MTDAIHYSLEVYPCFPLPSFMCHSILYLLALLNWPPLIPKCLFISAAWKPQRCWTCFHTAVMLWLPTLWKTHCPSSLALAHQWSFSGLQSWGIILAPWMACFKIIFILWGYIPSKQAWKHYIVPQLIA